MSDSTGKALSRITKYVLVAFVAELKTGKRLSRRAKRPSLLAPAAKNVAGGITQIRVGQTMAMPHGSGPFK